MAVLFVLVLLVVAKNGDGMRGSPKTESMLETEVTLWEEDPCAHFGAERDVDDEDEEVCQCPKERPVMTKECDMDSSHSAMSSDSDFFYPSKATSGCRCLSKAEAAERLKMPVAASALRFCEALMEHGYGTTWNNMKDALEKTSPAICQHALIGTITPTEAEKFPFAGKASELSQHGHDEDGDQDRGYGRMRAVKEDATGPTETALWEHALSQVCKDECNDLLKMMRKEAEDLEDDVEDHDVPFAQACAKHVVQHVEAEVLGCCGRSCGFNGRRCLLWPFFSPQGKVDWELECCAEISILKNSSRELMCNSVLPDRLAKKASQYDLEEENGTDVGKVLIGQNSSLFWTQKGAQEAKSGIKLQLPKTFSFILLANPCLSKKQEPMQIQRSAWSSYSSIHMLAKNSSVVDISERSQSAKFSMKPLQ